MRRLLRRARPEGAGADESGNMVIAMSVLLILTNLSLAMLARTLVNLHAVRTSQDFSSALAVADAGLSDALFQLDQGLLGSSFQNQGTSGSGVWTYHATKNADDSFTVQAKGVVNGSTHAIQATVSRSYQFPFALFSNQAMTFGGAIPQISSTISIGGAATGESHVGSNTSITVNGGSPGDYQDVFVGSNTPGATSYVAGAPGGGSTCVGCPNPVFHLLPSSGYALPSISAPTGSTQACPVGGVITGTVNLLSTDPMVCYSDVTISGAVTVAPGHGPFKLYVLNSTAADGTVTYHGLDMSTATINATGNAANFQIYKEGTAALSVGTGSSLIDVAFSGVLYAPESTLTISSSKYYNGSIVVDTLDVQGTPTIKLSWDSSLKTLKGTDWQVSRYTEVPSSSLTF